MFKLKSNPQTNRRGISIIEVLTSMAVATIGVFGVMVMIPFAVQQSQRGLDNDAASVLGSNAIEKLQMDGYLTVDEAMFGGTVDEVFPRLLITSNPGVDLNWNLSRIGQIGNIGGTPFSFPGLIHFDPIAYTAGNGVVGNGMTELILDPVAVGGTDNIVVSFANAARTAFVDVNGNGVFDTGEPSAGQPVTDREAARICRSRDQLFYDEDSENDDALAPPQPLFDVDGGNTSKRQASGRISWSAFLSPEKHPSLTSGPVSRFRSHVLVYRDRFVDPTPANRVAFKTAFPFDEDQRGSSYDYYLTNMAGNGFNSAVSQITFANDVIDTEELSRGDWVMLVNRILEADGDPIRTLGAGDFRAADPGFRTQIMFARVTRVSANTVSVEGGPFEFTPAGIPLTGSPSLPSSETYMVHLKDVVNVFERSVSVER